MAQNIKSTKYPIEKKKQSAYVLRQKRRSNVKLKKLIE